MTNNKPDNDLMRRVTLANERGISPTLDDVARLVARCRDLETAASEPGPELDDVRTRLELAEADVNRLTEQAYDAVRKRDLAQARTADAERKLSRAAKKLTEWENLKDHSLDTPAAVVLLSGFAEDQRRRREALTIALDDERRLKGIALQERDEAINTRLMICAEIDGQNEQLGEARRQVNEAVAERDETRREVEWLKCGWDQATETGAKYEVERNTAIARVETLTQSNAGLWGRVETAEKRIEAALGCLGRMNQALMPGGAADAQRVLRSEEDTL